MSALLIPALTADHAVEIRRLTLPGGRRRTESLMNDGTRRLIHTWQVNGETQFDAQDVTGDAWLNPDADYERIERRNPADCGWDIVR